jgi:acyl-CoA thioesterase FadM
LTLGHRILLLPDDRMLVEGLEKRICLDASDPSGFKAVSIPEDIYAALKGAVSD